MNPCDKSIRTHAADQQRYTLSMVQWTFDLSHIVVRQARAEDSAAVQALYFELTQDNDVRVIPAEIDTVLDDPRTCLIIAEADGKVIGTALVALCRDVMYGEQPFAVVENIVVTEKNRSTGVGIKLLEYIESYCRDSNCTKIMLLSSASRLDAHRFFEKCGFASDKKRGFGNTVEIFSRRRPYITHQETLIAKRPLI